MATEPAPPPPPPKRRLPRRSFFAVALGVVLLVVAGELFRRQARREWLTREVTAAGGRLKDYWKGESWREKLSFWFRTGKYPRRLSLSFSRKIQPEWLREHDYLRGLDLTGLHIGDNEVSGDELARLIEAHPLHSIYMIDAKLSERTLSAIADKRGLQNLQLSGCRVTDNVFQRFDLRNIRFLGIDNTGVTSSGLESLRNCEDLNHVMLDGRQISAPVAQGLATCGSLNRMSLVGAEVADADLEVLADIASLEFLELVNTKRPNSGIDRLAKAKSGRPLVINR